MPIQIKPKWAAAIWCDGDYIYAELPSVNGSGGAHTIKVPNDARGIQKILVLARSRNETSSLASRGDPLQSQISRVEYDPAMVRRARPKVQSTVEERTKAREILRRLGLI
jgi:hypothetical protein